MGGESEEVNIHKVGGPILKKLNLYTILQVSWLVEMYYLGINSIYNTTTKLEGAPKIELPLIVTKYNNLILKYLSEWSSFALFLSITLFICGFSISFIKLIPKLSCYKLLYNYSSYGMTAGVWLFFIYYTYICYLWTGLAFLFTPILVGLANEGLKKVSKILKEKFGISISNEYT